MKGTIISFITWNISSKKSRPMGCPWYGQGHNDGHWGCPLMQWLRPCTANAGTQVQSLVRNQDLTWYESWPKDFLNGPIVAYWQLWSLRALKTKLFHSFGTKLILQQNCLNWRKTQLCHNIPPKISAEYWCFVAFFFFFWFFYNRKNVKQSQRYPVVIVRR